MINITDTPIALLKHHIKTTVKDKKIIVATTKSLEEIKTYLLTSSAYVGNELWPVLYIIYYTGTSVLENFEHSENNTAYIVVNNIRAWKKYYKNSELVKFIKINPELYEHTVEQLKCMLEPKAYSYYWENYCIDKFNSSPQKWYNEITYLSFSYKSKGSKLTIEDIDFIYNKVSNTVSLYLNNIFTDKSKTYILQMTNTEKFLTFVGVNKSFIEVKLTQHNPELVLPYLYFKEAFILGKIRLDEGVIILDYIFKNRKNNVSQKQLSNLFGLL